MSDIDQLSQMARALRDSRTGQHESPESSRAVILTDVATKRRRRRIGVVWLVPLAAVLVLSTAVAAVGPARRVSWKRYLERLAGGDDERAPVAAAQNYVTTPASRPVEPPPPEDAAPTTTEPEPAMMKDPTQAKVSEVRAAARRPARIEKVAKGAITQPEEAPKSAETSEEPAKGPAPSVLPDEDGLLYARAHEAHFVQRNAAAALTAWDAYLAARPEGRFALEARYNRALCLVRLARLDEAKAALEPFRDGRFGSYRRVEATRLLDALNRR